MSTSASPSASTSAPPSASTSASPSATPSSSPSTSPSVSTSPSPSGMNSNAEALSFPGSPFQFLATRRAGKKEERPNLRMRLSLTFVIRDPNMRMSNLFQWDISLRYHFPLGRHGKVPSLFSFVSLFEENCEGCAFVSRM